MNFWKSVEFKKKPGLTIDLASFCLTQQSPQVELNLTFVLLHK